MALGVADCVQTFAYGRHEPTRVPPVPSCVQVGAGKEEGALPALSISCTLPVFLLINRSYPFSVLILRVTFSGNSPQPLILTVPWVFPA